MTGPGLVETDADLDEGMRALAAICPVMAGLIAVTGRPPLRRRAPDLAGLVDIVIGQQVSVASARAIGARLAAAFPGLAAADLAAAEEGALAACGLSRPKIRTVRALAAAVLAGELDPRALARAAPEEVRARLVALPGIGPWTADVYALVCLGHRDAFAPGDLALQEAARLAFGFAERPDAKALEALALRWRPWRAVAARSLWARYALAKNREGVVTPSS
jgi:DNA-3-methyladenine glycosylase II